MGFNKRVYDSKVEGGYGKERTSLTRLGGIQKAYSEAEGFKEKILEQFVNWVLNFRDLRYVLAQESGNVRLCHRDKRIYT